MSKKNSPNETKRFKNILSVVKEYIQGKSYTPQTIDELVKNLGFPKKHKQLLLKALNFLIAQKVIKKKELRYFAIQSNLKHNNQEIVTGTIRVHPRGFGFLEAENSIEYPEDIFIPKQLTMQAVDGDRVEVLITNYSPKGPEGRVIAILQRARTHVAGIIRAIGRKAEIFAYVPLLGEEQIVEVHTTEDQPLRVGDRIIMEVIDWGSRDKETVCKMSHYIGHISDPKTDIPAAIEEFELQKDFHHLAIEEAKSFGTKITEKDFKEREDLRDLETITIDPKTAKDFDDALSLSKDEKGYFHLFVHIADVTHYVKPHSQLDKEANIRCNSTYFPGFCLPMLPYELSENLCSLKPNVNRLAVSVKMVFDLEGTVVDYKIMRSVIRSKKRFSYEEAKEVLDGKKKSPYESLLKLMVELCLLLKKKRYERGSIEFAIPEMRMIIDENGAPVGTELVEYDITHQLVEEFMLKTNETIAKHLSDKGKDLTYRVHDEPAEEDLKQFSLLANVFGFRLSDKPSPQELQELFAKVSNKPYGQFLAVSYIRSMRLAVYSSENIGHYGLGLEHYCHFTSPIRRYADLVVHRILFGESLDEERIQEIANRCSEQERVSAKAEKHVLLLKKLRFLQMLKEKEPNKRYKAIITKVKPFGVFFEVLDTLIEGFIHVAHLGNEFYWFDEKRNRFEGDFSGNVFEAGKEIELYLHSVNLITLDSQWYLAN